MKNYQEFIRVTNTVAGQGRPRVQTAGGSGEEVQRNGTEA